jgi:hypothetical protein
MIEALVAKGSQKPRPASDLEWVYANLASDNLTTDDFPSLGTWSLWTWARGNREQFYEKLWPRTERARGAIEDEDDEEGGRDEYVELLIRM